MAMEHISDELLQRHFDGELEPSEQADARKHLADCGDCTARLRSLGRLQNLIRMAATDAALEANFQDMFARIERAAATPERVAARKPRPRWYRSAGISTAGLLAAAAAVLLMLYQQDGDRREPRPDDATGPLAMVGSMRSEIVHVDFGANAGTVFDIPLADGSSTPVVWINDEE